MLVLQLVVGDVKGFPFDMNEELLGKGLGEGVTSRCVAWCCAANFGFTTLVANCKVKAKSSTQQPGMVQV
jgi:hypothetical protein